MIVKNMSKGVADYLNGWFDLFIENSARVEPKAAPATADKEGQR